MGLIKTNPLKGKLGLSHLVCDVTRSEFFPSTLRSYWLASRLSQASGVVIGGSFILLQYLDVSVCGRGWVRRYFKRIKNPLSANLALALSSVERSDTPTLQPPQLATKWMWVRGLFFPPKTYIPPKALSLLRNDVWIFAGGAWVIWRLLDSLRTVWPPSTFRRLQVTFRRVPPFWSRSVISCLYS